jgi:hypothetical protein
MKPLLPPPIRQGPSVWAVLVAIGIAFIAVAYVAYLRPEFRVNQQFRQTTCVILGKQLIMLQDRNGTVYRPEFQIRYRAGNKYYETSTYNITGESTSGRAHKEEILSRYEMGQTYPCWYDPANPQVAVLVRGYSVFGFLLCGFGILIALIGAVGMV